MLQILVACCARVVLHCTGISNHSTTFSTIPVIAPRKKSTTIAFGGAQTTCEGFQSRVGSQSAGVNASGPVGLFTPVLQALFVPHSQCNRRYTVCVAQGPPGRTHCTPYNCSSPTFKTVLCSHVHSEPRRTTQSRSDRSP